MNLCRHGHPMTPENTGHATHVGKSGRIVDVAYCRQCRRAAAKRYDAAHKRPSRAKKKKHYAAFKDVPRPEPRLHCRKGCTATAATLGGILEHERRIHPVLW